MTGEPPRLPPPPPPPEFFPIPFARQRSTDHTQNAAGTSAYPPAGPPPGNNRPAPMPSPSTHTSQLYTSPQLSQPPPVRKSTRPHSNVTAPAPAPIPAFPTQPAPPYEYAPPPPAPPMSGSISLHSSISEPGPSIPARPPFAATGTNASGRGPRPPQRLTTMPIPVLPNTAASVPYHSGSSPPNIVYPPPQSVMSGGSPPNTQGWSYLEVHERDNVSSDSSDEDIVQSPDSMNNSSGYTGQKGQADPPYAGRRRRAERRKTASASSSQAPTEFEKCKLCPQMGPRREWARLGHGGFCSKRHKWQWEDNDIRK